MTRSGMHNPAVADGVGAPAIVVTDLHKSYGDVRAVVGGSSRMGFFRWQ